MFRETNGGQIKKQDVPLTTFFSGFPFFALDFLACASETRTFSSDFILDFVDFSPILPSILFLMGLQFTSG